MPGSLFVLNPTVASSLHIFKSRVKWYFPWQCWMNRIRSCFSCMKQGLPFQIKEYTFWRGCGAPWKLYSRGAWTWCVWGLRLGSMERNRRIKCFYKWEFEEERETMYRKTRKKGSERSQKLVRCDRRSRTWKEQGKRPAMEPMSWEHKDQGFLSWSK